MRKVKRLPLYKRVQSRLEGMSTRSTDVEPEPTPSSSNNREMDSVGMELDRTLTQHLQDIWEEEVQQEVVVSDEEPDEVRMDDPIIRDDIAFSTFATQEDQPARGVVVDLDPVEENLAMEEDSQALSDATTVDFDLKATIERLQEADTCTDLALVITAANSKAPAGQYTTQIKGVMDDMVCELKMLETYLHEDSTGTMPPGNLANLHREWLEVFPTIACLVSSNWT